ncbi:hypothetical protein PanWU01x14_143140 [Parasponia andersonii]|uniref:Uncharacterized protein n=1 Tax=Parasponia andersonii TaxID=3476 RepID=A0A2P5CL05_PARAD|nr:hypothetical protein PanWU01x14_143140 [Parasponia andersonii]
MHSNFARKESSASSDSQPGEGTRDLVRPTQHVATITLIVSAEDHRIAAQKVIEERRQKHCGDIFFSYKQQRCPKRKAQPFVIPKLLPSEWINIDSREGPSWDEAQKQSGPLHLSPAELVFKTRPSTPYKRPFFHSPSSITSARSHRGTVLLLTQPRDVLVGLVAQYETLKNPCTMENINNEQAGKSHNGLLLEL